MKNSKKLLLPALIVTVLAGGAFAASESFARGCPMMGGMGSKSEITDAQRAEARSIMEASEKKMAPLRDKLFVKRQELEALQGAATPDVNAVSRVATELTALEQKLSQEQEKLGAELDKTLGLEAGTHNFYGHGYGNRHNGSRGRHGGGHW